MADKGTPARPGATARRKRADEVRDEQIETRLRGMTNVPEETAETVEGASKTGKSDKDIELEVVGGVLFVSIGSETVRFERDGLFRLEKAVRRAKQGV